MPPRKRAVKGKKSITEPQPPPEDVAAVMTPVPEIVSENSVVNSSWSANEFCPNEVLRVLNDDFQSNIYKLDASGYFENYLWKHISIDSGFAHVFSCILMMNAKFVEGINVLEDIPTGSEVFEGFFKALVRLVLFGDAWSYQQNAALVHFLINVFKCLENETVRQTVLKYLSLPLWDSLTPERQAAEFEEYPHLERHWARFCQEKAQSPELLQGGGEVDVDDQPGSSKKRKGKITSATKTPQKKPRSSKAADTSTTPASTIYDPAPATWIPYMVKEFLRVVENCECDIASDKDGMLYLERFLEFLVDLTSQLPTRRFLGVFLDDMHVIVRLKRSALYSSTQATTALYSQLVNMLDDRLHFEVEDQTGRALSAQDVIGIANARLHALQRVAYSHYRDILLDLVFSSSGELGKEENLRKYFALLTPDQLLDIAQKLGYISLSKCVLDVAPSFSFVSDVLIYRLATRKSQLDALSHTSLYPTEKLLWDPNSVPLGKHYNGQEVLALPKLNLQFLTAHDYLLRNFTLFRLESAYEIRQDLVDAIKRVAPRQSLSGVVSFGGWARMALPIVSFGIEEVTKPNLGEVVPGRVCCGVEIDLSKFQGEIRGEWENLRDHDVVFLISIKNPSMEVGNIANKFERERKDLARGLKPRGNRDFQWVEDGMEFPELYGVQYVRAGEVFEVRDEDDAVLNDFSRPDERRGGRVGSKRRLRLRLDPAQYYDDIKNGVECYEQFNLLVRRKPKENNFKAVLETIRGLMTTAAVGKAIPAWLHDIFLGYGSPRAAHYKNMPTGGSSRVLALASAPSTANDEEEIADYRDTFLDSTHLIESFPSADVSFSDASGAPLHFDSKKAATHPQPPFKLYIKRGTEGEKDFIRAVPYSAIKMGPFPMDKRPNNTVRFTNVQVEAVRSGMNHGLTMIVGPPGTGKTDVAVQIICNLYHNYPTQKILVIAHSNTALNDVFEKIMERDVDPRHLLRLGSGEKTLLQGKAQGRGTDAAGEEDQFSKQGRVNWSLARRSQLLQQIQYLASSLDVAGDVGYTCETAEYFFLEHIQARIEKFHADIHARGGDSANTVAEVFPFSNYFASAPQPLFTGSFQDDIDVAEGCFRHLRNAFTELGDYRAFELLRTQAHRGDYLLTKQARIVAMTCTHAAMTRRRLVELGFKYDSIVMEEAAQVLEVETLIPMLLQDMDTVDGSRLKRVALIGDHHQLPPVVQHPAFQRYSRLDQSMFSRFVRLGVPFVQLDKQGRSRPELAALYSWRYTPKDRCTSGLGDLPVVQRGGSKEYSLANAGFAHTFQLVDVPAFQGKGEFCPTPHFYQNLGEAEYVVAVYQYMRLLGYPAEKISILTTYNGQKHLIRDILGQRCRNSMFGRPSRVTTVDKFQGQQNDYILLSLVRTESIGHLRDVRRLVVATSRARLGLYVFCRQNLFEQCAELAPTFSRLLARPSTLQLVSDEPYPATRQTSATVNAGTVVTVPDVTALGLLVYQMTQQRMRAEQVAQDALQVQVSVMEVASEDNGSSGNVDDEAEGEEVESDEDDDSDSD